MRADERAPQSATVSCIIAAYNSARFIGEALDSVLAQTVAPSEIIVIDDGSTDATRREVEAYAPAVKLVRQKTAGPAATRNAGVRRATGEFIAFLDADDRWHPEKLARQTRRFEGDASLDVCAAMAQNFWEREQRGEYERLRGHARAGPVPGLVSGTMMVRYRAFSRVGYFDEKLFFADGPEWFARARALGVKIALLGDVLLYHRMHNGNLSRRRAADSRKEFLALVRERLRVGSEPGERAGSDVSAGSTDLPKLPTGSA